MAEKVECPECGKRVKGLADHQRDAHGIISSNQGDPDTDPDWGGQCDICGQSPIVLATGMCGPCTFGEAETAGGKW